MKFSFERGLAPHHVRVVLFLSFGNLYFAHEFHVVPERRIKKRFTKDAHGGRDRTTPTRGMF